MVRRPVGCFAQPMLRLGVIGSGNGSNMAAIQRAITDGSLEAEIVLVLSDQADSGILEKARVAGLDHAVIDCRGFRQKFPLEAQEESASALKAARVDLVCLAGFMRIVGEPLLATFPRAILNIHPSLLPAYPGLMAWKQAIEDGAAEAGCTVHFVDAGIDTGAHLLQRKVAIRADDDATSLHARIQEQEHIAYPEAIRLWQKLA